MTNKTKSSEDRASFLETLRASSFRFEKLPSAIELYGYGDSQGVEIKKLEHASVDDIAFAQQHLNRRASRLMMQMDALGKLHDKARELGARGADNALEVICKFEEGDA